MGRYLTCLFIVAIALACHPAHAAQYRPKALNLLTRSSLKPVLPVLTPTQRQWLSEKKELVIGTSFPDYPPFDITTGGRDYQGLTAEYAGLIGIALGLKVRVLGFDSRQSAIEALKNGRIDLLGSANGYEAVAGLALSRPYAIDQPVLVTREHERRVLDDELKGLRLSMLYHYLSPKEVLSAYPKAELLAFRSSTLALNAVAFGQADVFIGDTISTHYQLNRGHLPPLRMASFGKHEAIGFSFALRRQDTILKELVDTTLESQTPIMAASIFKRWGAGSDHLLTDRKLQLSPSEEQWLREHPVMRVAINETAAPVSYFDSNSNFRGIAADLLDLIRLRTGLRFEIERASGIRDMLARLKDGRADVIAAISSDEKHDGALHISRPYLESTYVLVTRAGSDQAASLEHLQNRQVAITRDSIMAGLLSARYPKISKIETDSPFFSIALLGSGEVDAAITTLIDANHALAGNPDLVIRSTIGSEPATVAMATNSQAHALASILDKALQSISPEELGVINNRWGGYRLHDDVYWREFRRLALKFLLAVGLLLLLALIWNAHLRWQIRQRKCAERALNDQLEFMRALLNGTPHPMYVRDREGRLQSCNDSYLQAVEAQTDQVMGKRLDESPGADREYTQQMEADYQQVIAAGTPLILDRPLRMGGRELTIYHWILPYRDSLGEVQGIIGGWIDISDRRELVQELRLAKQRADDANRAKSTFLATISHEIRTPMNAVIGMLELAVRRADRGQLDRPSLEVAYHSAKDLLGLIGDILDIVRIESGHLCLSPESVDPSVLVESVARVFDGLARQKDLALQVVIAPNARCHALLDPLRFKQVLSNLVSNAIKFTEHGQIQINLHVHEGTDCNGPRLELKVRDTGIGIHEEALKELFNPFVQANPHSEGARAGTGLGLAISHSLSEMMGGTLTIKSLPGVGTQVSLVMPLQCVEAPPVPTPLVQDVEAPNSGLNVLVIDDHPANLLLMEQQLSFLGLSLSTACDGREGLEKWRAGGFDVVILDCNMPQMNGYQVAEAIRATERQRDWPRCLILGYTANAQPEVRQRCLDVGMDDCLLKPIGLHTLNQRLAGVAPGRHAAPGPRPRKRLALEGLSAIVGDDPDSRTRLLNALQESLIQDLATLMAIDSEDAQAIAAQAHKILSTARMLEARDLMEACEALEQETLSLAQLKLRRQVLARHMRRTEKALARHLQHPARAG
ncbi:MULTISPECIES: ATP-binding protein [Pseudomonas putida group]|uniref:histidine kinase n=1 Tax=Pseudomonas putida TaxID=303 RepID=A0A1B2F1X2_PSEPU|nr:MULTISPECIES: transporter substrate-binding domain-containing protein [Pseudomonas putida group]ANY86228.1 Virulence sensor protein BvgS precursor [Pseudomonas putida]MCL8306743.1 transporter substrate-binding domain-containing protein [Pseudomonas putida]